MKIGIAGPVATEDVAQHLEGGTGSFPKGHHGSPAMGTLISILIERGHQVSAYTLDATATSLRQTVMAAGPSFRLYVVPYRPRSMRPNGKRPGRIWDLFKDERNALQQAIADDKPDMVNAHWTYEYALAAIASELPHVITCRDSPWHVLWFMPNLYRLGRYFMARSVFKKGKLFIANTEYLKRQIQHYTEKPIEVIPNPAPLALFKKPIIERAIDLDLEHPKIAVVLNYWQGRKNPKSAFRAFSMLRQRIPGATLHLFGKDFGANQEAQIWAERKKISGGVVFHGFLPHDKLLMELKNMHLLLHPSLEESLGMCLVEAMALGLPVIGGDKSGAVPWVLDHGKAGVLTNVRSAKAIGGALIEVLKNKTYYEKLSHCGQERAHKIFSPAAVAEAYERMYARAIAEASQKALDG